ncbi:alcohol dehydrogenase [Limibacter armeniacum]|uniref:alcohol dehydrogenase n=1 Tax=Limibacter armeniacum TaxID=466084 RepID=UPI002FE5B6AD
MKAIQVSKAGGPFELVDREIPKPKAGEVLIKVQACGICHSDMFVKEGGFPGLEYPRIPGHEVIGTVESVGEGVNLWKKGQRVGVGWHGGHCHECEPCRSGDFINCQNGKVTGISFDGGYAEYMTAPQEAVASVPDELDAMEAAPLLCAGITTFNALRNSGAKGGDVVAVQGIGGLGHLAIQFAHKMGFKTVAISGSDSKKDLAKDLGAAVYINAGKENPAEVLQKLGGAAVILATAPNGKSISPLVDGLGINGKIVVVGAGMEPMEISPLQLIMGRKSVGGWPSGHAKDSEDTLNFSALTGAKAMIETYPLEKAEEAYKKMLENKARFRVVLKIS